MSSQNNELNITEIVDTDNKKIVEDLLFLNEDMYNKLKLSAMDIYNLTFNTSFQDIEEMKLETIEKKKNYLNAFEKYNQEYFFYSDANIVNVNNVESFIKYVKNCDLYHLQKNKWHFLKNLNCPNLIVMNKPEFKNEIK